MWHEWGRRGKCIAIGRKPEGKEATRKTKTDVNG
jgi:hypothetical protein